MRASFRHADRRRVGDGQFHVCKNEQVASKPAWRNIYGIGQAVECVSVAMRWSILLRYPVCLIMVRMLREICRRSADSFETLTSATWQVTRSDSNLAPSEAGGSRYSIGRPSMNYVFSPERLKMN